jgi:uncharacterized protein (TIGR02001 family)
MTPTEVYSKWSGQVRLVTNYVYRGYSKSNAEPAAQGNLDYGHEASGVFMGAWVSSVDFLSEEVSGHAHVEVSPYLGWHWQLHDDWRLDTTLVRYIYDGDHFGDSLDYNELYLMAHFRDMISTRFAVAIDAYGQGAPIFNYEVQGRYPLLDNLEASTSLGFEQAKEAIEYDYIYWNAGFTWFVHSHVALDLRYYDARITDETSLHGTGHAPFDLPSIDHNIVFAISIGF